MKKNLSKYKNAYFALGIFLVNIFFVIHTQVISNTNYSGSRLEILLRYSSPLLIVVDILSIVCILFLSKFFQRILFTANIIICAFISTYIHILNQPPTLTAMYNGIHNTENISLAPYLSYEIIIISLCAIAFINFLISKVKEHSISKKYLALGCAAILGMHMLISSQKNFVAYTERLENISENLRLSIQTRGSIATFFLEFESKLYKKGAEAFSLQRAEPSRNLSHLPALSASKNVVFIQIECLGYELLNEKVGQRLVMPFIHSLQGSSVVLKLEGIKLLGSANTDYEILTTRKASHNFMAYDFVSDFSDNIIEMLVKEGFSTRVFHNTRGDYMNLRLAYTRMGFEQRFFAEEIRKSGYTPLKVWKGNIFSDMDLFDFVQKHPQEAIKNFDFIITLSMHEPSYTEGSTNLFASSPHAAFFKACNDTDTALARYYASLPEDTLLIIYGDHSSYYGNATPYTAFIAHIKGKKLLYNDATYKYSRTDISHYLRSVLIAK